LGDNVMDHDPAARNRPEATMGPLDPLIELHKATGGWSTGGLIVLAVSLLLVGRLVMLGDVGGSWLHEHPLGLAIGGAAAAALVIAGLAVLFDRLLGYAWPALPVGVALLTAVLLSLGRRPP
jgi:hypothetical protein